MAPCRPHPKTCSSQQSCPVNQGMTDPRSSALIGGGENDVSPGMCSHQVGQEGRPVEQEFAPSDLASSV